MYATQAPVRELYERIMAYDGCDCFAEVLSPWLGENSAEVGWLAEVAGKEQDAWRPTGEELCRLYAFARVNELLLLAFQSPPPEGWPGPRLSREQYGAFLVGLGMKIVVEAKFDPLFHEIVAVESDRDFRAPIELAREIWPGAMLGDLVFSRAGTAVRAGACEIAPAIASGSTLYWAHRRHHRPAVDLSVGWGGNSQWRTAFRRDYVTASTSCFNADGARNVRDPAPDDHPAHDELSVEQRIELLTHRCFVRTELPHEDRWPYDDRLAVPRP